ncbi:50S ribosomal protein L22 [Candidatus Woesebacteria bacterium GWC2_33_12]|uniref:Large ribosomal subunit protein uL22 n=1 Tax=Candidatus Woesebacteria bacterium GW2011_GWB1_33_22 TaxID=1618566 RepID=A0A0F9ZL17_9BACT|nr:MAG: 50S ribosomal protein L22 [Candidatus Woesebacteria bacterium GW2011_GWC2_33_12]KKP42184.1 MAG: 50S ribosomal protein L22 [Candidatus Woesebacteria bacterium GW2011_GWA2_33_20]KKP44918.1 MAG: 50S ribosomal protein L22 [Candidatus Woesebacteria bacterium GW2011_GWB1_33_22]KKP46732.1 MAG: 50S ribosomal protein L22 [Microgenomates group bacterium GW2011_GWC1_33_28]KKP50632.1 MAG: 50S ribosomal protein L22 [Candidatus Woesebacteria bacterium GW2011_GWA1_33_33]OGM07776.1 MAG: 50S ribosomal 
MIIKSEQKHLIISPRKLRPIADVLRKLSVQKAIDLLPFIKKRGSNLILKVIKSAVANATQKGVTITELKFKEIQIGEGPRLKRGQPVSRGRWHPIKKRMSHIKIILMTKLETKHGTKS